MTCIHEKEVNKIAECNLLHDIINPPSHNKNLNSRYSPILHGCMNTIIGKAEFNNFRILYDIGRSYIIVMVRLIEKLRLEEDAVMQWHTQSGNITTNLGVKVNSTLPALSATNIVTWKSHVDNSGKGR